MVGHVVSSVQLACLTKFVLQRNHFAEHILAIANILGTHRIRNHSREYVDSILQSG